MCISFVFPMSARYFLNDVIKSVSTLRDARYWYISMHPEILPLSERHSNIFRKILFHFYNIILPH